MRARIVARSALGLHVEFAGLEASIERALQQRLDAIRAENKEFVDRAVDGRREDLAARSSKPSPPAS